MNFGCKKLGTTYSIFCRECISINCENADIPHWTEDGGENFDEYIDLHFDWMKYLNKNNFVLLYMYI